MHARAQVYISVASFSCAQSEDGRCACKGIMDNVGGSLCIYQPEPGKKIPTSSPSRFLRAPFTGCECAHLFLTCVINVVRVVAPVGSQDLGEIALPSAGDLLTSKNKCACTDLTVILQQNASLSS